VYSGKIKDVKVVYKSTTKRALVTFEKASAAKTASLLNNTLLGPNVITVVNARSLDDDLARNVISDECKSYTAAPIF
jgi:acetaldehyde dehydrogenase (acetylating)